MATGRGPGDEPGADGTLWCPWCGSPLGADAAPAPDPDPAAKDTTAPPGRRCAACETAIPPGAALARPPDTARMRPHDPDARLPARGPEGASPLPEGSPVPTADSMLRWIAVFAAALAALSLLAYFVAAPLLKQVPGQATPPPVPAKTP